MQQSVQENLPNLILDAPASICVLRGLQHVYEIANERYFKVVGNRDIIGKTVRDALPELKGQGFFEILDNVYASGKPFVGNELPVQLVKENGMLEEAYFNFVYQPTRNGKGEINGIFCHGVDVTDEIVIRKKIEESEKQQAFLLKLSDALRSLDKPIEIEDAVTKAAIDFMGADRCYFCTLEGDVAIINCEALRGDLPSVAGVHPISSFPLLNAAYDNVHPLVVDDVNTNDLIDEKLKVRSLQLQDISFVKVPVIKNATSVGVLSIVQSKPRKWTELEVKLIIEIAERTWLALERAKAEEALRKSEEKNRTLLTSIDQGFTLCELIRNKEGKGIDLYILEVNSTYEKQTGINKEMVIGKPLLQVFPSLAEWIKTYADVVDNQRPVVFEQYFTDTDRWFAVKAYPVEKERFAILFSNITERKKAEEKIKESEERFRSLAQTLPQLIWVADSLGMAEFFSEKWKEYSGIEPQSNNEWKAIVHPDEYESNMAAWMHCVTTGTPYRNEVRLKSKSGQYRWHAVLAEPVLDNENKIIKWVGAFTDIHEQKTFSEQLEAKIYERTKQLNEANETLEQKNSALKNMNQELEAFTYICSHDLQEPLRKIQTFAGIITDKDKELLSDTSKKYFKRMQHEASRMQTLIKDLLSFSRLNTSEGFFEITDLNEIIDDVKEEFKEIMEGKNAFIESTELSEVKIIPFQFRQLVHNLISNALKFSKPDVPPHIIIKSIIEKGRKLNKVKLLPEIEYLHLSFTDNGIGFDKQFSERIFEVFQKLHGKEEYAGSGIGLAIVKKVVENHKGIILAESEVGKGATFNIYLPLS